MNDKVKWGGRGRPPSVEAAVRHKLKKKRSQLASIERFLATLATMPDGIYDRWRDNMAARYIEVRNELLVEIANLEALADEYKRIEHGSV